MSEWWTYELSDFLLFSHRVYVRLFELHNGALWPLPLATLLAGAGILIAVVRPGRPSGRLVPAVLGALWLWIAWSFFGVRYATINWAAPYIAPLFALQGLALIALAAGPGLARTGPDLQRSRRLAAMAVLALAVFGYPLLAPALGRPLAAAEIFGIAPDPTVIATLAVLAASTGRWRLPLAIVPMLWSASSGLTLWTMGAEEALVAPLLATLCAAVILKRRRESMRPTHG